MSVCIRQGTRYNRHTWNDNKVCKHCGKQKGVPLESGTGSDRQVVESEGSSHMSDVPVSDTGLHV